MFHQTLLFFPFIYNSCTALFSNALNLHYIAVIVTVHLIKSIKPTHTLSTLFEYIPTTYQLHFSATFCVILKETSW